MAGDITRSTFRQPQHYNGVRMQQGRVQLDADWNEQLDIRTHLDVTTNLDVIGRCGYPEQGGGFAVQVQAGNLLISGGRLYVDGILCENDQDTLIALPSPPGPTPDQPDLPGIDFSPATGLSFEPPLAALGGGPGFSLPSQAGDGIYTAYLDVWQRDVTVLEDPALLETALGGPDTTTRTKTLCQVKLLFLGGPASGKTCPTDWSSLLPASTAQLAARAQPDPGNNNPCAVPAQAGYRSLFNQLYRVEIHQGGTAKAASFKWSRDNASVVVAWTGVDPANAANLLVSTLGRDQALGLAAGQWVELTDDTRELWGLSGTLVQLTNAQVGALGPTLTIDPATASGTVKLADFPRRPKIRRWDQTATATVTLKQGAVPLTENAWLDLENGVQVFFPAGGTYHGGDHWLIPARTATAISTPGVDWPQDGATPPNPLPQPPAGVQHHYCSLALLQAAGNQLSFLQDCRIPFPPLTDICAKDVCFDNTHCALPGASTVQQAIDQLCDARCGCCEVTVGPGAKFTSLAAALTSLLAKEHDICICLTGGDHVLDGFTHDASASQQPVRLKIEGCGLGTRIQLSRPLRLTGFATVALRDLAVDAAPDISEKAGAITFQSCGEVTLSSCLLSGRCDFDALLDLESIRSICLSKNVIEAHLRTSFDQVIKVFVTAQLQQLVPVFQLPGRTAFEAAALLVARQLAALDVKQRGAAAAQLQRASTDLTAGLTFGEITACSYLVDALTSVPDPEPFAAALASIRRAAIKAAPATAVVINGIGLADLGAVATAVVATAAGEDSALLEDNQIAGILSLYGMPPADPFAGSEIEKMRSLVKDNKFRVLGTTGTLRLCGNDLVRIALGQGFHDRITKLLLALGGDVLGAFGTCLVTENVIAGEQNELVGRHADLSSNDFTLTAIALPKPVAPAPLPSAAPAVAALASAAPAVAALASAAPASQPAAAPPAAILAVPIVNLGTVVADTALYVGNHGTDLFPIATGPINPVLFNVSRLSDKAANLPATLVDLG